jgi:riboflavin kinase/FMN adenylyltransferase
MKILHRLLDIHKTDGTYPAIGLTIGNFDGVHLGHRELLKKIKHDCVKKHLLFVVVTFIPHPQKILQPETEHFLINSYDKRRNLLKSLGVDILVEMGFTRDFSTLPPERFLLDHLLIYPELKDFYLGYDFAFGANKQGDFDLVKDLCKPINVEVQIQPKFEFNGKVVSSSLIRDKVITGKVDEVEELLARPFHLEGVVIKGEGRGKQIGFPTANIQVSSDLIVPHPGVYVTRTNRSGMTYNSITNIGKNPTFKDTNQIHVETNLFDFDIDIYGENLDIEFLLKLRDEKKFATVNDLIAQIKTDIHFTKDFLGKILS